MTETSEKSFFQKALDIDHRIIAIVIPIIIAFMIINPINIPFPISSYGQQFSEGEIVGFMMSDTLSTKPQLKPATVLTMKLLFEKNCKIVFWSDGVQAPILFKEYIEETEEWVQTKVGRSLEYGVDYVYMGYIAGRETGTAAFLADIRKTVANKDYYGNNIDDLPIMQGINDGTVFEYGFANCACSNTEPSYVRQWQQPYGVKLATYGCAMNLGYVTVYLQTGQLQAVSNGLLGSAEMEYLTGELGLAYGQTLAVSFAGLYFTILIILGNVFYFADRFTGVRQ